MKRKIAFLIFSIVFWLLILAGLLLFGLAFERVNINSFALKRNYYNSKIDSQQYSSGLYHKGLGFYFMQFPSSKHYLTDQTVNVTNADLQKVGLTYTLVYRIRPDKLYDLYQQYALEYQPRIIATIDVHSSITQNILSTHFIGLSQ